MAGALSGLGVATAGCGSLVAADDAGADAGFSRVISTNELTFEQFFALCEQRGGLMQTTASCAGNNACRGLSYLGGTLVEHSCKAMNGCGPGMQCVDLAPDQGRSGKDIYVQGSCAPTCHGQFAPSYDAGVFTLYVDPGTLSLEDAVKRFKEGSAYRLKAIIGFGAHGVGPQGVAFANMPGYYQEYSHGELDRVVDYIRTLPVEPKYYDTWGPADGGTVP